MIEQKANEYKEKIKAFKQKTEVKYLQNIFKRYYNTLGHRDNEIIEIKAHSCLAKQSIWLVETLIQASLNLEHPDELQWYKVTPGSVVIRFLAAEHVLSPTLIEYSKKKIEFMRLMGIISLRIGDVFVMEGQENKRFSFENSLIAATIADDIEKVESLLQHLQVDVNVMNTNKRLLNSSDYDYDTLYLTESTVTIVLRQHYTTFTLLLDDVEYEVKYGIVKEEDNSCEQPPSDEVINTFISIAQHPYSFLNTRLLASQTHKLSEDVSERVNRYCKDIENKKNYKTIHLQESLKQYIPDSSNDRAHITITLHSVWHACSMWFVEQLAQLIFSPTFFTIFQWFKVVKSEESLTVVFLVPKYLTTSLTEMSEKNKRIAELLGVNIIEIDDKVTVFNESNSYTFEEAIDEARLVEENEVVKLLTHIDLIPVDTDVIVTKDDINNNYSFFPDLDSTPLMFACCNDNMKMVKLLLHYNADTNVQTRRQHTALMYSCRNSNIFKLLLDHGADTSIVDSYNETVFLWACDVENIRIMELLIQRNRSLINIVHKSGKTPLFSASNRGYLPVVERLLQEQVDPNIPDNTGCTPLRAACFGGHLPVVERLLQEQVDPNIPDNTGCTPLRIASGKGYLPVVERLLQEQVDPNIPDNTGCTPLRAACFGGHLPVVERLLQEQVDPNIPDNTGCTPLRIASGKGYLPVVERLLQEQVDPNIPDNTGCTPLRAACFGGHLPVVERLLQEQVDPNIPDNTGCTPLRIASGKGHLPVVERLLQEQVDPNIPDNTGCTPLLIASANGHLPVVERLLQVKNDAV